MRILFLIPAFAGALCAATCDSLLSLSLPNTTITRAQAIGAGEFVPENGSTAAFKSVPAFCRVTGSIKPSSDSDIQFEVWMPADGWNGKLQGMGNGGFAGSINLQPLGNAVRYGYAAATTDTGHKGGDASWALGHPEKLIDFGYRAIHEMTDKAKAIVAAYYGGGPKHSYFSSCSNGGRQALMEAQRYPADYDGIIAGAPANYWTHLISGFAWNEVAQLGAPGSYIPPAKLKAIETAALAACDAHDGVTDGVIDDPSRCHFDPSVLLCKGAESDDCLTEPQVAALKKVYAGPKTSKGKQIFPGYLPGGETGLGGWPMWITGLKPGGAAQFMFANQYFGNIVFADPKWDFKTFNIDHDVQTADEKTAKILNSTDPDLRPFHARGGKLILFHGWNDAAISAINTIDYYQQVQKKVGAKVTDDFTRLYMVPGMQHCGGGPGPNQFGASVSGQTDPKRDMSASLERWVEQGVAPDEIIARNGSRTRPLCPYPQVAQYKGAGSTDDAANFTCVAVKPAK